MDQSLILFNQKCNQQSFIALQGIQNREYRPDTLLYKLLYLLSCFVGGRNSEATVLSLLKKINMPVYEAEGQEF